MTIPLTTRMMIEKLDAILEDQRVRVRVLEFQQVSDQRQLAKEADDSDKRWFWSDVEREMRFSGRCLADAVAIEADKRKIPDVHYCRAGGVLAYWSY